MALGGPIVEILYGIGLGDRIVGRTRWTTFPPAVRKAPDMGDASWPNLEAIVRQRPDLVLSDGHFASLGARLTPHHIPVEAMDVYETSDMVRATVALGERFGHRDGAQAFLDRAVSVPRELLSGALSRVDGKHRPSGLIVAGAAGLYFTFSSASRRLTLETAGARNVAADLDGPFPVVSREWVRANRPDFILHVPPEGADPDSEALARAHAAFVREAAFGDIPVITMDGPLTYGPRAMWGAALLASRLHPQAFAGVDVPARYRAFLSEVYGIAPSDLPPDTALIVP
ncbi:ABC transporter substrate-binding protein [Phaeovibrio sulfidiphilus]|uniref:ABC transporter substrate-binding protein n=1 Tax=Phaeovibrio sulfidiphilus TaxID=1220600 RepID=A0A8J6YYJ3_9PROT|nr:ABC transporter substrate-binding protein [Phaeovibrio sulfidiphilus]